MYCIVKGEGEKRIRICVVSSFFGVSVSPLVTPCDLALGVPLKQWHLSNHACVNLSVFFILFFVSLSFLTFSSFPFASSWLL